MTLHMTSDHFPRLAQETYAPTATPNAGLVMLPTREIYEALEMLSLLATITQV